MNQDGMRQGYDIEQLCAVRTRVSIPLIASGGAGALEHFADVFLKSRVDGALAAGVFHRRILTVAEVKDFLQQQGVVVRT
jgi:cyclase